MRINAVGKIKKMDRIKDIERNYVGDMKENSYLMSYGPGAIGF